MLTYSVWRASGFEIIRSFTLDNHFAPATSGLYQAVFIRTIGVGLSVAAIVVPVSYVLAYLLRFVFEKRGAVILDIILVSMFSGYLVRIYAWRTILGREGLLNEGLAQLGVIDEPLTFLVYSNFATVITLVGMLIPLAVLPIYSSMANVSRDDPRRRGGPRGEGLPTSQDDCCPDGPPWSEHGLRHRLHPVGGRLRRASAGWWHRRATRRQSRGGPVPGTGHQLALGGRYRVPHPRVRGRGVPARHPPGPVEHHVVTAEPGATVADRPRRGMAGILAARVYLLVVLLYLFLPVLVVVLFSFTTSPRLSLPIEGFTLSWYQSAFAEPALLARAHEQPRTRLHHGGRGGGTRRPILFRLGTAPPEAARAPPYR